MQIETHFETFDEKQNFRQITIEFSFVIVNKNRDKRQFYYFSLSNSIDLKIICEQIVRKFRSQLNVVIVIDSIDNRNIRNLYIVNSRDRDNKRVLDCDVVVIVINFEIENIFRIQNFFLEILRYF